MLLAFLQWQLEQKPADESDEELYSLVWLANSWMQVLAAAGPFLSDAERHHVHIVGCAFQRVYIDLASKNRARWYVRPKFHLLTHVVESVVSTCRNPLLDSAFMDEDWLKQMSRIIRRCHKVTCHQTALQRWLLCIHQKLKEVDKQNQKDRRL